MKNSRIIVITACLIAFGSLFTSCSQSDDKNLTDEDKQYFEDVTFKAYDDWNRGDREAYVSRYSANAVYMAPNMEAVVGTDGIRRLVDSYPDVQVTFPIAEILGSRELAVIRGTFVLTDSTGASLDKGKYVSIWQRSADAQWQLTHDIYNSDLPLPVPAAESQQSQ